MQVWPKLIRVEHSLLKEIETELKTQDLPGLTWYDVLLELSREETESLRPKALENRLLLTQYNISRLLDRLVNAGLVKRQIDKDDRRAQVIVLTQKGRDTQQKIWAIYGPAIQRLIGEKLSETETQTLLNLLIKLQ